MKIQTYKDPVTNEIVKISLFLNNTNELEITEISDNTIELWNCDRNNLGNSLALLIETVDRSRISITPEG
jgi:hypothetical protein